MILAARSFRLSDASGFNVMLIRDWALPLETLPARVFAAFDEATKKMKSDPNATRLTPITELQSTVDIHTCEQAALRVLPERIRPLASLYTCWLSPHESETKIQLSLPSWCQLSVEGKTVGVRTVENSRQPDRPRSWTIRDGVDWAHLQVGTSTNKVPFSFFDQPRLVVVRAYPALLPTIELRTNPIVLSAHLVTS